MAYRAAPDKTIIWHELAKHNAIMKKIPSKIWYGAIARVFMQNAKVVARSVEARNFAKKYCMKYRYKLSTKQRVEQFLEVKK